MPSAIVHGRALHLILGVGYENSTLPFMQISLCGDKRLTSTLLFNHQN